MLEKTSIGSILREYIAELQSKGVEFGDGTWLCGGAIRRAICGHSIDDGDFDIYTNKKLPYLSFEVDHDWKAGEISMKADMMTRDFVIAGYNVQFHEIKDKSLQEVLAKFDFTCCQFGFDGKNAYCSTTAVEHARQMRLEFTGRAGTFTLARAFRFMRMGFKPSKNFLKEMERIAAKVSANASPFDPLKKGKS